MKTITSPDVDIAKDLFFNISERLWESFDYLLQKNDLNKSPFASLIHESRNITKAPPFFFAAHHAIVNYFTNQHSHYKTIARNILEMNEHTTYAKLSIHPFLKSPNLQDSICLNAILSDIRQTYDNDDFLPIAFNQPEQCAPTKLMIESALDIIKISAPSLYTEIEFIINEIRIFSSGNIRAGSNFNTLGLIYISQQIEKDDVSRYVEHITHEAAHNLLYAHWTTDPLFNNHSDQLYYTPFRNDRRPLSAIFHAMFVLARTIYVFDQVHRHSPHSLNFENIKTNYNERGNSASFKTKFSQTVRVISKNAKLTVYGKEIYNGCLQMVEDCELEI